MPLNSRKTRKIDDERSERRFPPSTTPEGRENQLIALAVDLAEQQLRDGTASAQVISHYLRLGSTKERLEKEKLMQENELLKEKTRAIKSARDTEKLYRNAVAAMMGYVSHDDQDNQVNDRNEDTDV